MLFVFVLIGWIGKICVCVSISNGKYIIKGLVKLRGEIAQDLKENDMKYSWSELLWAHDLEFK